MLLLCLCSNHGEESMVLFDAAGGDIPLTVRSIQQQGGVILVAALCPPLVFLCMCIVGFFVFSLLRSFFKDGPWGRLSQAPSRALFHRLLVVVSLSFVVHPHRSSRPSPSVLVLVALLLFPLSLSVGFR